MKAFVIIFALAGLAAGYKIQPDKEQLIKVPKTGQCDPDMTPCPSGCCPVPPELNWFCCPDAWPGCAATAEDCTLETKSRACCHEANFSKSLAWVFFWCLFMIRIGLKNFKTLSLILHDWK